MIPAVLSIAGSDSSGGAGVQADIKTIEALGCYAETAIAALTAQNTRGVRGTLETPPAFLEQQIEAVFDDIRPAAVKIGMLGSAANASTAARTLERAQARNIVLDPVMVATSGSSLMAEGALDALTGDLLPLADIVTPNVPEAEVLAKRPIRGKGNMEGAARAIQRLMGPRGWVLVKGGHLEGAASDLLLSPEGRAIWIEHARVDTRNTHGTGCTLSSAIACGLARGRGMRDAVADAKDYLTGALEHDPGLGSGNGPLDHMWRYR